MATTKGNIKKTKLSEFSNLRANGLIAIKLDKEDSLVSVHATTGEDYILLLSKEGKAIKFSEKDVRPMGRATTGVRGIRLSDTDRLIGMEVFPKKEVVPQDKQSLSLRGKRKKVFRHILTISERGLGKRTATHLFPTQRRGGKGVKAAVASQKTGSLTSAIMVTNDISQVILTSKYGQVVKLPLKDIPQLGRATQGVILMRFADKTDSVAAVTALQKTTDEE